MLGQVRGGRDQRILPCVPDSFRVHLNPESRGHVEHHARNEVAREARDTTMSASRQELNVGCSRAYSTQLHVAVA
jgi:hypothetical protein